MFGNLRLVRTDKFIEYRANTELYMKLGNEAFAAAIRAGMPRSPVNEFRALPWLLYHSWRKPPVPIDEESANIVRDLIAGRPIGPRHLPMVDQLQQLGWCDEHLPVDLDELAQRTQDYILAIQNRYELRHFLDRVQKLRPRVIVEIGTARGGMLYCFSQLAAPNAMLISIDLPGAPNCGGQTETEREVFATFGPPTQRFHFIPDDSQLATSREKLLTILANRTIDLLFIDGDHSVEGCSSDFNMYSNLVSPDGLLAFHDICWFPDQWPNIGVGVVWQAVKARYGGEEIVDPHGAIARGLPPGQTRWGIGVVEGRRLYAATTEATR